MAVSICLRGFVCNVCHEDTFEASEEMPGLPVADAQERTRPHGPAALAVRWMQADRRHQEQHQTAPHPVGGVPGLAARGRAAAQTPGERAQLPQTRGLVLAARAAHPPRWRGAPRGHGRRHLRERLVPADGDRRRGRRGARLAMVRKGEHSRLQGAVRAVGPSRRARMRRHERHSQGARKSGRTRGSNDVWCTCNATPGPT